MASVAPSPSVVPSAAPPAPTNTNTNSNTNTSSPPSSATSPPPPSSSSSSPQSPPSQPNANPPATATPSTPSQSPPPPTPLRSPPPMASTPPSTTSPPPSTSNPPPPPSSQPGSPPPTPSSNPPTISPPPPANSPPPASTPPPTRSPPSANSPPPVNSPPPTPPRSSPPPPSSSSSPPPQTSQPPAENSPPPTSSTPPQNSSPPPPPSSRPPANSPPPAAPAEPPTNSSSSPPPPVETPRSSPPPLPATPPEDSPPPPPVSPTPSNSPSPPKLTPPASQPSPNSTQGTSPPSPVIRLSPPPQPSSTAPDAPESSNSTGNGGISTEAIIAIGAVVGLIAVSLLGLLVWYVRKRRKDNNVGYVMPSPLGPSPRSDLTAIKMHSSAPLIASGSSSDFVDSPTEPGGLGNSRSWFTYEELVKATNGFSAENLLGEGGFGSVYKGLLPDQREVAVKRLNIAGGQGEREFKAEVEIISRIHHRHLVSLVGYCISEDRRLLIYDYVPNNSLHFHLHGEGRPVLDWATRVRIAAGAARGIAYLHEDCHPRIIHRDIKSSNILLDNNFEAKVSDFGLAKLALDANTHITTRVMGTFGYMAPEYASSGKLTEKSDVFSYGVVLLELITGRKPVDASQPLGEESLVEWARPLLSYALENENFEGLVDPRLGRNYVESEMFRMIQAAAACVRHSAAKRPRMGQVVRAFDSLAAADLTNGMRVGESEVFNSAEQSAEIRLFRRMAFGSQNYSTDFFSQGSNSSS